MRDFSRRAFVRTGLGFAISQVLQPAAPGIGNKLIGVSIGIDDYLSHKPLSNALNDATAVETALAASGYRLVPRPNYPDSDQIWDSLIKLVDQVDKDSSIFIYFAGHGVTSNGRGYFLPIDAPKLTVPNSLSNAITFDSILEMFSGVAYKQLIAVFDACRGEVTNTDPSAFEYNIVSSSAPDNSFVVFTGGPRGFALDNLGPKDTQDNGIFVRNLVELMQPHHNVVDLMQAVRPRVRADAKSIGHYQNPFILDNREGSYFINGEGKPE